MIFYVLLLFSWQGAALIIITALLRKLSLKLFSHKKSTQYGYYIPYLVPVIVSASYWYETVPYIHNYLLGYAPAPPYYFPKTLYSAGLFSNPSDGELFIILLLITLPVNLLIVYAVRRRNKKKRLM